MSRPDDNPPRRASKARSVPPGLLPLPCACANIRRLSRLVTRLYDAELRDSDLEVTQFGVLSAIDRLGNATHGELARGFGMDTTTMSRVIAVLERRGWVGRRPGTDKRQRIYAITADGRRQVEAARAGWRRAQERLSAVLGAEALSALTEATARMSALA